MRKCFFIHEKEANSILPKSGLKYLVAVTPSVYGFLFKGARDVKGW